MLVLSLADLRRSGVIVVHDRRESVSRRRLVVAVVAWKGCRGLEMECRLVVLNGRCCWRRVIGRRRVRHVLLVVVVRPVVVYRLVVLMFVSGPRCCRRVVVRRRVV